MIIINDGDDVSRIVFVGHRTFSGDLHCIVFYCGFFALCMFKKYTLSNKYKLKLRQCNVKP